MNTLPIEPAHLPAAPLKAMVFIDGQNLFHRVKSLFGHQEPDFDIRSLSGAVCKRMGWEASEVFFYSGIPTLEESPHWHRFWNAKLASVQAQSGMPVHAFTPPLRYRNEWTQRYDGEWRVYRSPQEKGVDVRLALDMVAATYERRCDAMVLMTEDSDLQQGVDRCLEIAKAQGRNLLIANAIPQDFNSPVPRRALNQTTPVRFDKAFYESHIDANQSAHFGRLCTNIVTVPLEYQSSAAILNQEALQRGHRALLATEGHRAEQRQQAGQFAWARSS